jgi:hypothetical protein
VKRMNWLQRFERISKLATRALRKNPARWPQTTRARRSDEEIRAAKQRAREIGCSREEVRMIERLLRHHQRA